MKKKLYLGKYLYLNSTNVSFNEHHDGSSLISITNGMLYLVKNLTFINNGYYENIFMIHLSTVICIGYTEIINNRMRQLMKAISRSYFIMKIGSTLNINNNIVHNIAKQVHTYEGATQPICLIQFYSIVDIIILIIIHRKLMFKYLC